MSIINKLVDKLSDYIRLKGEKLKLEIIAQISRLLAHFVALLTMALIGLFLLIFLSLALANYLNFLLESPHYGYLIVAGVYFIVFITILLLLRTNKIQRWLESSFVKLSENVSNQIDEE